MPSQSATDIEKGKDINTTQRPVHALICQFSADQESYETKSGFVYFMYTQLGTIFQ